MTQITLQLNVKHLNTISEVQFPYFYNLTSFKLVFFLYNKHLISVSSQCIICPRIIKCSTRTWPIGVEQIGPESYRSSKDNGTIARQSNYVAGMNHCKTYPIMNFSNNIWSIILRLLKINLCNFATFKLLQNYAKCSIFRKFRIFQARKSSPWRNVTIVDKTIPRRVEPIIVNYA